MDSKYVSKFKTARIDEGQPNKGKEEDMSWMTQISGISIAWMR